MASIARGDPSPDLAPGEHETVLPRLVTLGGRLGAVPGRSPDATYPRGTIFIGWSPERQGAALAEWDVEHARLLRQRSFGWQGGDVKVARSGNRVAVVANTLARARVKLAVVDANDWRLLASNDLGVSTFAAVAMSGSLVAVWHDAAPYPLVARLNLLQVDLLDLAGHVLGTLSVPWTGALEWPGPWVAVIGDRAYVVVPGTPTGAIAMVGPDGGILKRFALTTEMAALSAHDGRLEVGAGPVLEELSPELEIIDRRRSKVDVLQPVLGPDGRIVGCGRVLSAALTVQAVLRGHATRWCHDALWSGGTAVMIGSAEVPSSWAWVSWFDPGEAGRTAPAEPGWSLPGL
jgi:hypothetical protein